MKTWCHRWQTAAPAGRLGQWHPGRAVTPRPTEGEGGWLIYGREELRVSPSGAGGELPWRWANKAPATAGSDAAPVAKSGAGGEKGQLPRGDGEREGDTSRAGQEFGL